MLKKILLGTALVIVIGGLVFGAVNRSLAKTDSESTALGGNGRGSVEHQVSVLETGDTQILGQPVGTYGGGRGQGGGNLTGEHGDLAQVTAVELSVEEIEALLYMREEEKLAHDVYVALYDRWGLPIFQNISQSELSHTNSIKNLLDRYGLVDPASSESGIFTNPDLQALYIELVARGEQSLSEALKTGAAIEEIDILDLEKDLSQINQADIRQVFQNLLQGSQSHLRAFASNLSNQSGEVYQPQYMPLEQYQTILSAQNGNGNARNTGSARGGGGYRGGQP
jgi:hypothetical protein